MVSAPPIKDLTPPQVKAALDAHEILLIDVREPAEFAAERIHGAFNFPLATLDPGGLPAAAGRRVVLQCGSGKRSAMAIGRCQMAGHTIDAHLAGGIMAWKAVGLPTVTLDSDTGALRDQG